MNCDDYLAMLETVPIDEMQYGGAREHVATCRDCDRVTRVVAERERNMLLAYGDVHASVPAPALAAGAIAISRRRETARFYQIALAVTVVAFIAFAFLRRTVIPPDSTPTVSEVLVSECLPVDAAADVIRAQAGPTMRLEFDPTSSVPIIRFQGTAGDLALAKAALYGYGDHLRGCTVSLPPAPLPLVVPGTPVAAPAPP